MRVVQRGETIRYSEIERYRDSGETERRKSRKAERERDRERPRDKEVERQTDRDRDRDRETVHNQVKVYATHTQYSTPGQQYLLPRVFISAKRTTNHNPTPHLFPEHNPTTPATPCTSIFQPRVRPRILLLLVVYARRSSSNVAPSFGSAARRSSHANMAAPPPHTGTPSAPRASVRPVNEE